MAGLFGKAMKDAAFSVTTTTDGGRSFNKDNDNSGSQNQRGGYRGGYRGRNNRGRSRGRGRSGGNWRGSRGGYRGRGRSQSQEAGPRSYLDDDDESMDDDNEGGKPYSSRYTPYGARPPSRRGFRHDDNTNRTGSDVKSRLGNQFQSNSNWYKVTVVKGKTQDKDWLIKRIQNTCEEAFQAVDFHYMGDSALFFVEGKPAAEALKRTSHQITLKNGSKIIISVRPSDPPRTRQYNAGRNTTVTVNPETVQVLKDCLSNRYDVGTRLMNLSDLYNDEVLKGSHVQGHIYKPHIAGGILKIIGENCQDMEGLDLSDNRLYNLDSLKDIGNYAPNIKYLKLANNQFKNIEELDKLKGLSEVKTLDLSGNPLCDKFDSDVSYVNAVRIRFPKVIMLDGSSHKPPIGFEVAATTALPKVQESYLADSSREMILGFLEQYFKVFDSGDRQPLLEAYHDQAMFSLCTNTGMIASRDKGPHTFGKDKGPRGPSLGDYMKMSRNMLRRKEADQRASLIKHNRLSVVAMLNELPPTTHDLSTFIIDINFVMSTCLSFSIRGLFMEANKTLRSFSRVFVAVPGGDGKTLRIVNDQLHIRSPTLAQVQAFQKQHSSSVTPTAQATPSVPSLSPSTSTAGLPPGLTPEQQQMIVQFSLESKMNAEWSFKCLSQNSWNYQKAAEVFTDLNSKGSIPADAFATT